MQAKSKYKQFRLSRTVPKDFYWDDKTAGINVILARLTKDNRYLKSVEKFCDQFMPNFGAKYTPRGLLFRRSWSPLEYASGDAFICIQAADLGLTPERYREFAKKQIHYILGDSGLGSYVVGYGPSPPKQPHHRGSSCPLSPHPCNFTALHSKENNPNLLYGAVVGGPDIKDQFFDDRTSIRSNRVALSYNAAFQSTVAALRYTQLFPPVTTTTPTSTTPRTTRIARPTIKYKFPTTPATKPSTTNASTTLVTQEAAVLNSTATNTVQENQNALNTTIPLRATTEIPRTHNSTFVVPASTISLLGKQFANVVTGNYSVFISTTANIPLANNKTESSRATENATTEAMVTIHATKSNTTTSKTLQTTAVGSYLNKKGKFC